jgi:hypothetical protein
MGDVAKDCDTDIINADGGIKGATTVWPGPLQQCRMTYLSLLMPRPDAVS